MIIAIPREIRKEERRVALVPETAGQLVKAGFEVRVEAGSGKKAFFPDDAYREVGANVTRESSQVWGAAEILVKVGPPAPRKGKHEVDMLQEGGAIMGFLDPLGDPMMVRRLADRKVTAFSMEMIPRIARAQSMDALSSQASVAGYKAALLAATSLGKFFPMLTTAAGTVRPARVFVIGAGVAGLQAIATSRRLGAVVEAFDIRTAAKEEVESLGAKFVVVELDEETEEAGGYAKEVSEAAKRREQEVLASHVAASDVVITTAQVPGRRAPLLVTKEMVAAMKPGSVIVDLASEQGGNCEATRPGREVMCDGVTVMGPVNLPSSMPLHASQLYSRNVAALLQNVVRDGELHMDFSDEIIDGCCVSYNGEVRHARVREAIDLEGSKKAQ